MSSNQSGALVAPKGSWRLAQGVELLGEFEGAAFSERPWLLRRGDGQVIQLSRLLYAIASYLDGKAASAEIAEAVSARLGRSLSAENVEYLVSHKLTPLGVIGDVSSETAMPRSRALLSLRFRVRVVPERAHRQISLLLRPLFAPPVVLAVLAALIGTDLAIALTGHTGPGAATRELANHPALLLLITALVFASAAIHEMGHATAVRYGGANPGVMGVGIYLVWPVFYTDVSDAYRLDRKGRLRTDLGGVYFNAIILMACSLLYLSTHFLPLLVFVVVGHLQLLYQFVPFVRMDGYWILSDLVGVPNLFAFMGPILVSFGRTKDPRMAARLAQIKPWARRVITVWVSLTVGVLALNAAFIVWVGPRILTTDLVASRARALSIGADFARTSVFGGLNDIVSLVLLVIPAAGIILIAALLSLRTARAVMRWWPEHRIRAVSLGAVGLAALAAFGFEFVPKEIARPLQGGLGGSYWNHFNSPGASPSRATNPSALPGTASLGDQFPRTAYRSLTSARSQVPSNPVLQLSSRMAPLTPASPAAPRPTGTRGFPTATGPSPTVRSTVPPGSSSPSEWSTSSTTVPMSATKPGPPTPSATIKTPAVTVPPVTVKMPAVPNPTAPTSVKAPAATVPKVAVNVPPVTLPPVTVKAPTVTVPPVTVKTPPVTVPSVSVPPVTVPSVTVKAPSITVPPATVKTPTVTTPKVTVKTPSATTPTVKAPKVTVKTPAVKVPPGL